MSQVNGSEREFPSSEHVQALVYPGHEHPSGCAIWFREKLFASGMYSFRVVEKLLYHRVLYYINEFCPSDTFQRTEIVGAVKLMLLSADVSAQGP